MKWKLAKEKLDRKWNKEATKKKQQRRRMNEINSEKNKLAYKKQSALLKNLARIKWTYYQENYTWKVGEIRENFSTSTTNKWDKHKNENKIFSCKMMTKTSITFSRLLEKNFGLKLNPTIKMNYLRKTATFFSKITKKEIEEVLHKNRPKYCLDCYGLNYKFLRKMSDPLAAYLEQLLHRCITKSFLPDALKIAKVVPLQNEGDKHEPTNHRPISLLQTIGKFLTNWSIKSWYSSSITSTFWVINSSVFGTNGAQLMLLLHWWKQFVNYEQTELMRLGADFLT